jgi:hypothetical protein
VSKKWRSITIIFSKGVYMKVNSRNSFKYFVSFLTLIITLGLNTYSYASVKLIYNWLYAQQNINTGLLPSQEDSTASTYNNALAVIAFTLENNKKSLSAKKILDFYNQRRDSQEFIVGNEYRGFYQYRDSNTGEPSPNSNRWMGDNAWLLLAIQYYKASTGDAFYDEMAANIVELLKSLQRQDPQHSSCSLIASGWENGDTVFNENGHTEGNLDAYKALSLVGETTLAEKVKCWLDYNNHNWKNGPLDIHAWRVLSLGLDYGFALNDTEQHKRNIKYSGKSVSGFMPYIDSSDNIWSEGTGFMAVAFYKAGYKKLGNNYVANLKKLLFEPQSFKKTKTISYLALPDNVGYPWVDTTKGHVAGVCWYIFSIKRFDPI